MARDTNVEPRNRPLDQGADWRRPQIGVNAAGPENSRPFRREYDSIRLGIKKGPEDIVVLD